MFYLLIVRDKGVLIKWQLELLKPGDKLQNAQLLVDPFCQAVVTHLFEIVLSTNLSQAGQCSNLQTKTRSFLRLTLTSLIADSVGIDNPLGKNCQLPTRYP